MCVGFVIYCIFCIRKLEKVERGFLLVIVIFLMMKLIRMEIMLFCVSCVVIEDVFCKYDRWLLLLRIVMDIGELFFIIFVCNEWLFWGWVLEDSLREK